MTVAAPPTAPPAAPAPARAAPRARGWKRPSAATVVNAIVVAVIVVFVLKQLQPSQLLKNTTAAGGDMGAHVWQPAYLRDHLLPHFRLTGWAPDWYAGFPALVFYFPLPSLAIVMLGTLLPYGVAFKLVTVLGVLTLPIAAYIFGRLSDMPDPGPACLAVATLPFLFDRSFTIYGGNIPSTLAGEFAFSISLSLAIVFLGVVARGLRNGRHRALAALLLAVIGLCHVIPAFFALAGCLVMLAFRFPILEWRDPKFAIRSFVQRLRWALPVLATAGALAAFWILPFL